MERKIRAVKYLGGLNHFGADEPLVLLLDRSYFRAQLAFCRASFPGHWLHCFAVKANPSRLVLEDAVGEQFGLEAASLGELRMARRTSVKGAKVMYDSPLKSRKEIVEAIGAGALLHADNFQELEVVADVVSTLVERGSLCIGMRVNPQVGAGSLEGYSTATLTSKFGVGLRDDPERIFEAYKRYPWLRSIMCHVGSQGVPFDLAVTGIRSIVDFALEINKRLERKQIDCIDIGGGMSVNFSSDEVSPTFSEYSAALLAKVPELFDKSIMSTVVTEFGRSLIAKAGFFASRVEYVKETGGRRIAIQYAGLDVCARTVYQPTQWPLRVTVLDGNYIERSNENLGETDIAGPCCLQADIVAHKRMLPQMERGDTILLHDTGGYYHSAHNTYNLRQSPSVWYFEDSGANDSGGPFKWTLIQEAEPLDRMLDSFCEPSYLAAKGRTASVGASGSGGSGGVSSNNT